MAEPFKTEAITIGDIVSAISTSSSGDLLLKDLASGKTYTLTELASSASNSHIIDIFNGQLPISEDDITFKTLGDRHNHVMAEVLGLTGFFLDTNDEILSLENRATELETNVNSITGDIDNIELNILDVESDVLTISGDLDTLEQTVNNHILTDTIKTTSNLNDWFATKSTSDLAQGSNLYYPGTIPTTSVDNLTEFIETVVQTSTGDVSDEQFIFYNIKRVVDISSDLTADQRNSFVPIETISVSGDWKNTILDVVTVCEMRTDTTTVSADLKDFSTANINDIATNDLVSYCDVYENSETAKGIGKHGKVYALPVTPVYSGSSAVEINQTSYNSIVDHQTFMFKANSVYNDIFYVVYIKPNGWLTIDLWCKIIPTSGLDSIGYSLLIGVKKLTVPNPTITNI